jgi:hypothetical protein
MHPSESLYISLMQHYIRSVISVSVSVSLALTRWGGTIPNDIQISACREKIQELIHQRKYPKVKIRDPKPPARQIKGGSSEWLINPFHAYPMHVTAAASPAWASSNCDHMTYSCSSFLPSATRLGVLWPLYYDNLHHGSQPLATITKLLLITSVATLTRKTWLRVRLSVIVQEPLQAAQPASEVRSWRAFDLMGSITC